MKKAVESLTQELVAKTQRIEELQAELASKNIRIQELDAAVTGLSTDKEVLTAENEAKAKTVAEQDKALNTAWFVSEQKELKDQNILTNTGLFQKSKCLRIVISIRITLLRLIFVQRKKLSCIPRVQMS